MCSLGGDLTAGHTLTEDPVGPALVAEHQRGHDQGDPEHHSRCISEELAFSMVSPPTAVLEGSTLGYSAGNRVMIAAPMVTAIAVNAEPSNPR